MCSLKIDLNRLHDLHLNERAIFRESTLNIDSAENNCSSSAIVYSIKSCD